MVGSIAVEHIVNGVLEDVAAREARVSFKEVKARSRAMETPRDVCAALLRTGCSVITEIKRAVPFQGQIASLAGPDAVAHMAQSLETAGVHLIAVQTEARRFEGSLEDMQAAREATAVPMICRDIIVDPYQIHEARCFGADMVPLQVELLENARMAALLDRIESLGMTALAEVRTPEEADRALNVGAKVIGVNAWSLASDSIDRDAFRNIVPCLPQEVLKIAVGGVASPRNLLGFAAAGADAVLIGQSVMSQPDPAAATRMFVAAGQHPACPSRKS